MTENIYAKRLARVRDQFEEWGVDGLLIGSPSNRRWLSGFTGTAGWLIVTPDNAVLATDFRYWEQAVDEAPAFQLHRLPRTSRALEEFILAHATERRGGGDPAKPVAVYAIRDGSAANRRGSAANRRGSAVNRRGSASKQPS